MRQASDIVATIPDNEPALPDIEVGDDETFDDNLLLAPGSSFDAFFVSAP